MYTMTKNYFNCEIGCRIRNIRESSHYTREILAEKADISVQFLADIETGRKSMTVKTLKNICESLHVTSDYIVFGHTQSCDNSIVSLCMETLSPKEKKYSEELLKLFIKAVSDIKNMDD